MTNIEKAVKKSIIDFICENTSDEMMAYHGTSSDFNNFDTKFIGTGEGSQAYGWGIYVTQNEGTGRYYAEVNNSNKPELVKDYPERALKVTKKILYSLGNGALGKLCDYKVLSIDSNRKRTFIEFGSEWDKYSSEDKNLIADSIVTYIKNNELGLPFALNKRHLEGLTKYEYILEVLDQIATYASKRAFAGDGREPGHEARIVYQVDIPDDDGKNYFYWERPVSDEDFKKIFIDLFESNGYKLMDKDDVNGDYRFVNDLGRRISIKKNTEKYNNMYGFTAYGKLSSLFGSNRAASIYLSRLGYIGITMPIGYIHGNESKGLRNYVIFDPKNIRIVKKIRY